MMPISDTYLVVSGMILFLIICLVVLSDEAIIAIPIFGAIIAAAVVFGFQLGALGYFQ